MGSYWPISGVLGMDLSLFLLFWAICRVLDKDLSLFGPTLGSFWAISGILSWIYVFWGLWALLCPLQGSRHGFGPYWTISGVLTMDFILLWAI